MSIEIETEQTQEQIDAETLASLGAPIYTKNFVLPPITAGKLALLDLLDSPLISGKEMTKRDLWIAAYVITMGKDAMLPINSALREIQALGTAKDLAGKDTAYYESYLAAIRSSSSCFKEFDDALMGFVEASGLMSGDMQVQLMSSLEVAFAGFSLIKTDSDSKKKVV